MPADHRVIWIQRANVCVSRRAARWVRPAVGCRYENRDTLEQLAYEVLPDGDAITDLLARVKAMLEALAEDRLTDDVLPPDHWAHSYCPYLHICEPGQKAMALQAGQPKTLPDKVLADMIAKRIVAKKAAVTMTGSCKKKSGRSLADLTKDLGWE